MKFPTHKHFDSYRKTTWLYFDDEAPRESVIRGGVCFPMHYQTPGGVETGGYAVLAGQDLLTGMIHVYTQSPWVTVLDILAAADDPVLPLHAIKYRGISDWFNAAWKEYFGRTFYFTQPEELSRRFRLQISRSPMINPKPIIVEVPVYGPTDFMDSVWHGVKSEKLKIPQDSELFRDLGEMMQDDKVMRPSVHALGCCLLGYERFPWRKPFEKPVKEIFIPSS
jgi:hypothetical protein